MLSKKMSKATAVILIVALSLIPINVFAEKQVKKPTFQNKTVTCTLNCTFHWGSDDVATAITEWSGKSGYSVKTVLWQCQDSNGDNKKLGVSTSAKKAIVTRYKSGVYYFMSKHYGRVGNTDNKNTKLAEISDW